MPAADRLHVRLEKKGRRGKTVTVIEGLDGPIGSADEIARSLKTRCGTGGTVKAGAIELQGDHREAAAGLLRDQGFEVRGSFG